MGFTTGITAKLGRIGNKIADAASVPVAGALNKAMGPDSGIHVMNRREEREHRSAQRPSGQAGPPPGVSRQLPPPPRQMPKPGGPVVPIGVSRQISNDAAQVGNDWAASENRRQAGPPPRRQS